MTEYTSNAPSFNREEIPKEDTHGLLGVYLGPVPAGEELVHVPSHGKGEYSKTEEPFVDEKPEVNIPHTSTKDSEESVRLKTIEDLAKESWYTVECCTLRGAFTFGRSPDGKPEAMRSYQAITIGERGTISRFYDVLNDRNVGETMGKIPLEEDPSYTLLAYNTVIGETHPFRDPRGRPGNFLRYNLVLPNDEANRLWNALQKNPVLARTIAQTLMKSDGRGWVGAMAGEPCTVMPGKDMPLPPYEEWQALNGSNLMAFYSPEDNDPRTCKTVEFRV